jgi:hypothetical protein
MMEALLMTDADIAVEKNYAGLSDEVVVRRSLKASALSLKF